MQKYDQIWVSRLSFSSMTTSFHVVGGAEELVIPFWIGLHIEVDFGPCEINWNQLIGNVREDDGSGNRVVEVGFDQTEIRSLGQVDVDKVNLRCLEGEILYLREADSLIEGFREGQYLW